MKNYDVSVIANVTITIPISALDMLDAARIVDGLSYDELLRRGRIRIYSCEAVDPFDDVVSVEIETTTQISNDQGVTHG